MNENLLVAVCGYAGDARQISMLMPWYLYHECPVVVLSPDDSPITPDMIYHTPRVTFHSAGKRAYDTPPAVERFKKHLEILLAYPKEWFLIHDSDSFCLSPALPEYLFAAPDVLWSSEISDTMHKRPDSYKWPRIAFHPPWFMSREVLKKLVDVWDSVPLDSQTPFIDNHMMRLAEASGIVHRPFVSSDSLPTWHEDCAARMSKAIRENGRIMVHSVKTPEALYRFLEDYKQRTI